MEIWVKNVNERHLAFYDEDASIGQITEEIEFNGYSIEDIEYAEKGSVRVIEITVR